jgi:hypothetical protein
MQKFKNEKPGKAPWTILRATYHCGKMVVLKAVQMSPKPAGSIVYLPHMVDLEAVQSFQL